MCLGFCFAVNIVLLAGGNSLFNPAVIASTIIATTVNASGFYMAIIQITTVAYPTVMRSIAFGTLNITNDVGTMLAIFVFVPLKEVWAPWPYLAPMMLVVITFVLATFLQPETKGKPLPDTYDEARKDY